MKDRPLTQPVEHATLRPQIDWGAKLKHFAQALAFSLSVAAIQYAFDPAQPFRVPAVHSLAIGFVIWAVIDFGRHLLKSETGWPTGWRGFALVGAAIVAGYLVGHPAADALCRHFGWTAAAATDAHDRLRSSILITALAGIAASYYFYSRGRSAWLERRIGEVRRHADEARLKLLEAQLEPHMLFNTLANLRALIAVDPARSQQMLDHLIAYLRATLGGSRAATHSLQSEFERLRDYLELMTVRMGPRLTYLLDLPAALASLPVPALLLQPLVENSIRHGLEPKVEGGSITVSARLEGERLVLEVADTGVGLPETTPDGAGSGFGVGQVRARLATLYGARAAIELSSRNPVGARAVIHLPLST